MELYDYIVYAQNMIYKEKETMQNFGKNVQKYRKLKGITQEQLGELCGCSAQTISGTETGYSFPCSKVLFKLPIALDVPLLYLFNFGENIEISNKEELLEIAKIFSKLNVEQKALIKKMLKALVE